MYWGRYVPVAERREKGKSKLQKILKGKEPQPIAITGKAISKEFWGKKWCDYLETFADYDNRLPRGKTYVRNGSVCHLEINKGLCTSYVSGSDLYRVKVEIKPLSAKLWGAIKNKCKGQIGSILELLQGKLSRNVMEVVSDHSEGLFPKNTEISYSCSCPDWADMCKHVAAVLYAIGSKLDHEPQLLFLLRDVDPSELISTQINLEAATTADQLATSDLSSLFGIEIDSDEASPSPSENDAQQIVAPIASSNKSRKTSPPSTLDLDTLTGHKLQDYREHQCKLSVQEFASSLGVTPATIYRWEKSTAILNLQERAKLALTTHYAKRQKALR
jgi:uncharacterized Zn finger protein